MKVDTSRAPLNAVGVCAMIWVGAILSASSVNAATANISASATIVPPVALSQRSDIRFSSFASGATPGAITLRVPSALPVQGSDPATPIENSLGAVQISGPPSSSFSASTQPTTMLTSGDNTIILERIELRYGADGTAGSASGAGTLNRDGDGTIIIGAVLNVAARQPIGAYQGNLAVSVDY